MWFTPKTNAVWGVVVAQGVGAEVAIVIWRSLTGRQRLAVLANETDNGVALALLANETDDGVVLALLANETDDGVAALLANETDEMTGRVMAMTCPRTQTRNPNQPSSEVTLT
jgi:hypothetical protein